MWDPSGRNCKKQRRDQSKVCTPNNPSGKGFQKLQDIFPNLTKSYDNLERMLEAFQNPTTYYPSQLTTNIINKTHAWTSHTNPPYTLHVHHRWGGEGHLSLLFSFPKPHHSISSLYSHSTSHSPLFSFYLGVKSEKFSRVEDDDGEVSSHFVIQEE